MRLRNSHRDSKLARRLVRIFVLVVAVPLVVTVLTLGFLAYTQMADATRTMNSIYETAIADSHRSLSDQGGLALRNSALRTQQISTGAIRSMSEEMAKEQERSLHATAHDFSVLTHDNVRRAMDQSVATNRASLDRVGTR